MSTKNKYAIIQTGGKQYRVAPGEFINVELLEADANGHVQFDQVLFLSDGSSTKMDPSDLKHILVFGEVVGTVAGKKIDTLKYKASHNQCRRWGHRQKYTRVKITDIGAQKAHKKAA